MAELPDGIRVGDWVRAHRDHPQRVLSSVDERGSVRLSDPRDDDGDGDFGGYFIRAENLGTTHKLVEAPE